MRIFKAIALSGVMAFGVASVATSAFANDPKKVEKKCDKDGKACEKGDNCKPENCKAH